MKKNILNSPRLIEARKKKKKVIKKKAILAFVAIVVLFGAFALVSRISALNIKSVTVYGNKVIDTEEIQQVVQDGIKGHYVWFIPKTNILIYPKKKIIHSLETNMRRIKDLKIEAKDQTLEVSLGEREGVYTWCGEALPDQGLSPEKIKCQFMDERGYAFDEAPYFSNDVYLKFFGLLSDSRFEPENFERMTKFLNTVKGMELEPSSVLVKENGEVELYLASGTHPSDAPKIVFAKDSDFDLLANNLESALLAEPLAGEIKEKYASLLYIDLRFDNRVYYKFK